MDCPAFAEEYSRRRKEFDRCLKDIRKVARRAYIDAAFLGEIASLAKDEYGQATILICRDLLTLRGKELESWLKLKSYLTLVLASPEQLDVKGLGIDVESMRDLPVVKLGFYYSSKFTVSDGERLLTELREAPWQSCTLMFAGMLEVCSGSTAYTAPDPTPTPKAYLNTYSLLDHPSHLEMAIDRGGSKKLQRKLSQADEIPSVIAEFLKRFREFQPAPSRKGPGRPPTFRLAWMRRAAKNGWTWTKFRECYRYYTLDDSKRKSLDHDIRQVLYKK